MYPTLVPGATASVIVTTVPARNVPATTQLPGCDVPAGIDAVPVAPPAAGGPTGPDALQENEYGPVFVSPPEIHLQSFRLTLSFWNVTSVSCDVSPAAGGATTSVTSVWVDRFDESTALTVPLFRVAVIAVTFSAISPVSCTFT